MKDCSVEPICWSILYVNMAGHRSDSTPEINRVVLGLLMRDQTGCHKLLRIAGEQSFNITSHDEYYFMNSLPCLQIPPLVHTLNHINPEDILPSFYFKLILI
jgi:hypothetical protein